MVMSRDTCVANTAMLAACRLEKIAGRTKVSRVEENIVVWISFHLFGVVLRVDERFGNHTLVDQNIWYNDNARNPEVMDAGHARPCYR